MFKIVHLGGYGCILRADSAVVINLTHTGLVRSVFQCFLDVQHPPPHTHRSSMHTREELRGDHYPEYA